MTESEARAALKAIGLRSELKATGSPEWQRIFILNRSGVTQGRISVRNGVVESVKWYVHEIDSGPVLSDERWPWAWWLWFDRREVLTEVRWLRALAAAKRLAEADRALRQVARDLLPPRKRKRLALRVRSFLSAQIRIASSETWI